MSFLEKLNHATDTSGFWQGLGEGVGSAAQKFPGLVMDVVRSIPGDEKIGRLAKKVGRASAKKAEKVFSDQTVTGQVASGIMHGLDAAWNKGIEEPVEGLIFTHIGGMDAYSANELAKKKSVSLGETILGLTSAASDATYDALGIDNSSSWGWDNDYSLDDLTASGAPGTGDDAYERLEEDTEGNSEWAGALITLGVGWFADPLIVGTKVVGPSIRRSFNLSSKPDELIAAEGADDLGHITDKITGGHRRATNRTQKIIGEAVVETAEDGSTVSRLTKVGWLDGKTAVQIERGLGLDKMAEGNMAATMLERTQSIEDAVERVTTRRDILAAMYGDPNAVKRLMERDSEYGYKLYNLSKERGTNADLARAAINAADEDAIAAGTALPAEMRDEVVEATTKQLDSSESYRTWLQGMSEDRVLRVSAKGNRAIARLRREGIGRNGRLNTGFDVIDKRIRGEKLDGDDAVTRALNNDDELVGTVVEGRKPVQSIWMNGPYFPTMRYVADGMRRVGKAAVLVAPKGASRFSLAMRDNHAVGVLNTEDAGLVSRAIDGQMRIVGAPPEMVDHYLSQVTRSENAAERARIFSAAQTAALQHLAKRTGHSIEAVTDLATNSERMFGRIRQNQFSAVLKESGIDSRTKLAERLRTDQMILNAGEDPVMVPVYVTQSANDVIALDLNRASHWLKTDHALRAAGHAVTRAKKGLNPLEREAAEAIGDPSKVIEAANSKAMGWLRYASETANNTWKTAALLTRPVSYATRNLSEELMRVWALGMTSMVVDHAREQARYLDKFGRLKPAEQVRHSALNIRREHLATVEEMLNDPEHIADVAHTRKRLKALRAERANAEAAGAAERVEELDEQISFHQNSKTLADRREWLEARKSLNQIIKDTENLPEMPMSGTRTSHGIEVPEGYADLSGEMYWKIVAGHGAVDLAASDHAEFMRRGLMSHAEDEGMSVRLGGKSKAYVKRHLEGWAWIANRQIRQDPLARIVLRVKAEGGTTDDMIEAAGRFLHSDESASYRRMNPMRNRDWDDWAKTIVDTTEGYVPSPAMAKALGERDMTPDELGEMFDMEIRPDIHLMVADNVYGRGIRMRERWSSKQFARIDRMSVQRFTRHPMFTVYFNAEQDAQLGRALESLKVSGGQITSEEINAITDHARRVAMRKMKQTFYDNHARSSAAHNLRFIYPFFAAHQDAMTFWGRTLTANPDVARKLMLLAETPQSAGLIIDRDGNPVERGSFIEPDHQIVLPLPKGMGGPFRLNEASLNLVTQNGSVFNPGAGPLGAVTAGYFQEKLAWNSKEASYALRFFNQFGTPQTDALDNPADAFTPTSVKRLFTAYDATFGGENSAEYTRYYVMKAKDATAKFHKEKGRWPNARETRKIHDDVAAKVRATSIIRLLSSVISPAQPRPVSAYQGIIDEYHRYADYARDNDKGPFWAQDKIYEDYGDWIRPLIQSSSQQRAYLDPTIATGKALKAHKRLLEDMPYELYSAVIGPEGAGDFNIDTFRHIRKMKKADGTAMLDHEQKDLGDVLLDAKVAEGWDQYHRAKDKLLAEAEERGFDSIADSPELSAAWKDYKAELAKYNTAWGKARKAPPALDFETEILPWAEQIASNQRLLRDKGRNDIVLLGEYLKGRKKIAEMVAQRHADGAQGTTINAKSNADLQWAFADFVSQLEKSSPNFQRYIMPAIVLKDPMYNEDILDGGPNGE